MKKFLLMTGILSTSYGHAQWAKLTLPVYNTIVSSSFISDSEGWIGIQSGGTYAIIFHTADMGDTWTADTIDGASGGSVYLQFITTEVGYCVVNGEVYKTPDGGNSWDHLLLPGTAYNEPCFLNEDTGFIIGDEVIFKTTDGGQSWDSYSVADVLFNELHFRDALNGIGCEYAGDLYVTDNGGQTWNLFDGGLSTYFYSTCYSPDGNLYYTGYTSIFPPSAEVYGGTNFYSSDETGRLYDIRAYSENRIYAAGQYGDIVFTENGGFTWLDFNLPELLGMGQLDLLTLDGFNVIYAFGWSGKGFRNLHPCLFYSDFDYTVNELQVQFTDLTPVADSWIWTFDDGTTSTQQHPLHHYAEDGDYHVCLVTSLDTCTTNSVCHDVHICASNLSQSSIGSLDSTFDLDGMALVYSGYTDNYCQSFAIQPDHKIVATTPGFGGRMMRFNDDGSADTSFSSNGILTLPGDCDVKQLGLASNGKILVGGPDPSGSITLIRYEPNGTKDLSFGTNGKVTLDPSVSDDNVASLIIQNDDKMVLLDSYPMTGSSMHVIRLNADSSYDLTFSGDGISDLPGDDLFFSNAEYGKIICLNNGKLALAVTTNSPDDDFAVIRLNSNGSLDSAFSGDGLAITSFSNIQHGDYPTDLVEQPDGKLVVIGYSDGYIAVARYNVDGSLDATFGNAGKATLQFNNNITHAYAVALQNDGKILITGKETTSITDKIILVQLNTDGSLDSLFGNNGYVTTSWNCTQSIAKDIAVDGDKIYVGGGTDGISQGGFAVIRYLNTCPGNVVNFNYTITELGVQFTDQSTAGVSWFWEFGDGTSIIGQNPFKLYAQEGIYKACLTVTDTCGSNWYCQTIVVCNTLNTDYTYQATGLTTQFSNTTTEALTFLWNFGDGTTSTQQNPVHTFSAPGTYYVCLIESDACNSDTVCTDVIVCGPLTTGFSYTATDLSVQFMDASVDAISWNWDFGDGNFSSDQSPLHLYALPGIYEVCLITGNGCILDTLCQTIIVIATTLDQFETGDAQFEIFPNPATDFVSIKFFLLKPLAADISLYDLTGRKLKTIAEGNFGAGNHSLTLSVQDLPKGMYLLQLTSEKKASFHKLIRQ